MYVRQIFLRRGRDTSALEQMDQQKCKEPPRLMIGSFLLTADYDDSDKVFIEKAKNELRETPEVVEQALKDIRVLLQGESELTVPDDDAYLQKFLRPCKWYAPSAFGLMKRFYRFRLNHPRYSVNLVPTKMKGPLSCDIFIPIPTRAKDGTRVLLINAGKWNPKMVAIVDVFKAVMLTLDAAMAEPKTQIAGSHVILNMEGFTLTHVTYFTPSFASHVAEWVQKCLPCRLKGIHVVNQNFIFNMVFAIFKPFLQEKTRKRLYFHGSDRTALINTLGTKALPVSLGGEIPLPDTPIGEAMWNYFCCFEEEFEESNRNGYLSQAKR